jgi:uncharacterized RDD family membrane protein YckC
MKRRYFLKKAIKRAHLSRVFAKGIDMFLALLLSFLFFPLGLLLAVIYLAVSDALQEGQSVGKRFVGFSVISLDDGSPCSLKQSIVRNLPFTVPLFLAIIPIWGVIFSLFFGLPLILLELYLLYKLDSGHRLGDVMADTTVMGQDGAEVVSRGHATTSWFKQGQSGIN